MVNLAASAARGAVTTLGGQGVKFLIQLASLAILARILSPTDYGIMAMVMAIAGLAFIVGDFGLSAAAIQSKEINDYQRTNLFWINTSLGLILGAGVYFSALPISRFYANEELIQVTQVISIIFVLSGLTAQFKAEASRKLRFFGLAAMDVASQGIALCVAVIIALYGGGYWALVGQQIAVAAVSLIWCACLASWFPGIPRKGHSMRSLLTFGANTTGVQVINYFSSNTDSALIGRYWGSDALGLYDRAYQLFRMPLQQIAAPMTRVALPILSRIDDKDEYNRFILRAQVILTYLLAGMFFIAVGSAGPLLEIVLGSGWGESTKIFQILAIGGAFQAIGYVYYWIFLSKALTGMQLKYTIIARVLMVVFMVIGNFWGPIGVAIAVSLGLLNNWALLTVFALPKTSVNVSAIVRATLRPLGLYTVMLFPLHLVAVFTKNETPLVQLLSIVAAAGVFLAVSCLIRPIRNDVKQIIGAMKHAGIAGKKI